ncbi:MAG: NADH-quinone oxidoreductase subunit C [Opitutales bacterium]|jgi:NADH-quinone oxidoreductase subunit C
MKERIQPILKAHPYLSERDSADHPAVNCPQEKLVEFLSYLKNEQGFDFLSDLTAIDHFESFPRFEVVYHLYSTPRHKYLRVASPCSGETDPVCPTVVSLWPGANWHEREAYDMFGIHFAGHPDLRRILMWDGYPYHPLRKEFPLAGKEVDFPSEELMEQTGTRVKPAPMAGGPFHAPQSGSMVKREPRADDESWNEHKEKPESPQGEIEAPREFKGPQ